MFRAGSIDSKSVLSALALCASRAMVGVTRQDGRGPVDLFQKHDANHLVRPGRGAERQPQLRHAPQIRRKSVRATDYENSIGDLIIPPAAKMPGKSPAVEIVAVLIERDQQGFYRDRSRNRRGLLGNPGGCVACPALRYLDNLKAAESEFAADVVESLAVAFSQFPLRALFPPPDGNDEKAHACIFRQENPSNNRRAIRCRIKVP